MNRKEKKEYFAYFIYEQIIQISLQRRKQATTITVFHDLNHEQKTILRETLLFANNITISIKCFRRRDTQEKTVRKL